MDAARPVHSIECQGMIKLEKLRGKVTIEVPRPSSWPDDYCDYWPPAHAVLTARVINKGIMKEDQDASDWVDFATNPGILPPVKVKVFAQLEEYIRLLIPSDITDDELQHALCAVSVNTGQVDRGPENTMIIAVYNIEYSLLGHMCKPNCEVEEELLGDARNVAVYTIDDIEIGERLGISFLMNTYYTNIREIRRAKLKECFGIDCACYVCQGETSPGSDLWIVDKQKSLLIAPWSFRMARHAMVNGWSTLCDSVAKAPTDAVEMLESSLDSLQVYLDQRNIMLLLTAMTLFMKHCRAGASAEAVHVFFTSINRVGLKVLMEYGTRKDVAEITGNLCNCLLDVERGLEFHEMFKLTQEIHPRRPSCAELCDMLQLSIPPYLSADDIDMDHEIVNLAARADRLGIPRDFYVQQFRQLRARMPGGRPHFPTLIEACQDLAGIKECEILPEMD